MGSHAGEAERADPGSVTPSHRGSLICGEHSQSAVSLLGQMERLAF